MGNDQTSTFLVVDFWRKVMLMLLTAQMQGTGPVVVSRVLVGHKSDRLAGSNVGWRFSPFFTGDEKPSGQTPRDDDELRAAFEALEPAIWKDKEGSRTVAASSLGRLIGQRQTRPENRIWAAFDKSKENVVWAGGAYKKNFDYDAERQHLYRLAVAFGFCPERPRDLLDAIAPATDGDHDWLRECRFEPSKMTKALAPDPEASEDEPTAQSLARDLWEAFAGHHEVESSRYGKPFEAFYEAWIARVFHKNESLRPGVEVKPGHGLVVMEDGVKKAKENFRALVSRRNGPGPAGPPISAGTIPSFSVFDTWTQVNLTLSPNGAINLQCMASDPEDIVGFTALHVALTSTDINVLQTDIDGHMEGREPGVLGKFTASLDPSERRVNVMIKSGTIFPSGRLFDDNMFGVMQHVGDASTPFSIDIVATVNWRRILLVEPDAQHTGLPVHPLDHMLGVLKKHERFQHLKTREDITEPIPIFEARYVYHGDST